MTEQAAVRYCRAQPAATEGSPFGPGTLVFKVRGKIFALINVDGERPRISLKCEPSLALALRDQFAAVVPGYHLNKKHWNTVALDGGVPRDEIEAMIDHSYAQVVARLPKAEREGLPVAGGC